MIRYLIVSILSGFLFGFMDGLINANPLARRLLAAFQPIMKSSINMPAGIIIDFIYGFAMAGIFTLLYKSLPGASGILKGLSFGLLAWFFRVVMQAASQWMMFNVPAGTVCYLLIAGLFEMLVLGIVYGIALKQAA